jgi:cytochrome c oxidase subunit 3
MSADAAAHHDDHHHHAKPRPEEWPEEEFYGKASVGKVGMWIFLLSDALMFFGFLLAYGILRGSNEVWNCSEALFEAGKCAPGQMVEPILGIEFTAILTFLLICSSVTMVLSYAAIVEKKKREALMYLGLTIIGGILFLCGQYQEYWGITPLLGHSLIPDGLVFGQSHYASTFYLITSFHGAHVFTGVCYLTVMWFRIWMGKYDDGNYDHIEICGLFWHFVDLVWILVFTLVYLIPLEGA